MLCHLFDQPTHSSAMFICDRCGVVKEEAAEGWKISCIRWRPAWGLPCATM
nr:Zinc uptake regulation protein [Klebsiella pneumoniae]